MNRWPLPEPMNLALAEAEKAADAGEVPIGAVVIKDGAVIAAAHNAPRGLSDPTAHAEVVAIRNACTALDSFQVEGCEIYSSCEPCPMCLGAIYWARLSALHIGVPTRIAARAGFDDGLIREELKRPAGRRRIPTHTGVMAAACRKVFQEWEKLNGVLY